MKTILTITMLLFCNLFTFGQTGEELNVKHYLDFENLEHFDTGSPPLSIRERVNYELYLKVNADYSRFKHPTEEEKKRAFESKAFQQAAGTYDLVNEYQKFHYTIDAQGFFVGAATLEQVERTYTYYWYFIFEKGILREAKLKSDPLGNPLILISITDSLMLSQVMDTVTLKPLWTKTLWNWHDYKQSIKTVYYKNKIVRLVENSKLNTRQTFYENGNAESYKNSITNESIEYDEMGRKTRHSYPSKEKGWCNEDYESGIIVQKTCKDDPSNLITYYYYKNGKLETYRIVDHNKAESRTYDKKNKLVIKEEVHYKTVGE